MIRPTARTAAGSKQSGKLQGGLLAQGDEVYGLAPGSPFLSTAGCRHLADYARQHLGCIFPADEVEALESLVDEVERVAAIGKDPVSLGRKEEIRQCGGRGASGDGGQHSTFGGIAMPPGHPAPQPALEGGEVGPACQRRTLSARGCTVAISSDTPRPVKQSEVCFLLRNKG